MLQWQKTQKTMLSAATNTRYGSKSNSTGMHASNQTDRQTFKRTGKQTDRRSNRQHNRSIDLRTDRLTDRKTCKQSQRETDRHRQTAGQRDKRMVRLKERHSQIDMPTDKKKIFEFSKARDHNQI